MVDLDLDVTRWRDGRVEIEDEDEFEQHRVEYSYPNDVVEHALASMRDVLAAVRDNRAPLGAAPDVWLDALVP